MIIAMYLYLLYLFVGEGIVDIPLAFTDPSDRPAGTDLMPTALSPSRCIYDDLRCLYARVPKCERVNSIALL